MPPRADLTLWHAPTRPEALYRCVHVFSDGKLDRSPGGTGTSAMLALFERRGRLKIGDTVQSEGLLGSGTFEGTLLRAAMLTRSLRSSPTTQP